MFYAHRRVTSQPQSTARVIHRNQAQPNYPRTYQITDDYDYLLPAYTISDAARQDREAEWAGYRPMTLQCSLNHDNPGDGVPLSPEQCPTAEALFRNAGRYAHFHAEIQELREELRKNIWGKAPDTSDTEVKKLAFRFSPRTFYAEHIIRNQLGKNSAASWREVDLSLQRDLGMAVTSELNANLGLCVFVWMYPRNLEEVGFLEESIKKTSK
jgi:hypothetical protein